MALKIDIKSREATDTETGAVYLLGTSDAGTPVIHNPETGKYWVINWAALLQIARTDGIDVKRKRT
jgi:hypothetical protein